MDKNEELFQACLKNSDLAQVKQLAQIFGVKPATVQGVLSDIGVKAKIKIFFGKKKGTQSFYSISECKAAREKYKTIKNKAYCDMMKNNDFITSRQIMKLMGFDDINQALTFLKTRGILPVEKTKNLGIGWHNNTNFYLKSECEKAITEYNKQKNECECMANNDIWVQRSDLAILWGLKKTVLNVQINRMGIRPVRKFNFGRGCISFYDRAECERARPFINQPEQKEVEKVEEVNLLESELDSEELASENGSALNDAELAAIITACKDPVDKIMILSALCFGVKSGELSSLNLRDISGADICLQSPSGVVKMRIPKQYEDARTDLITYYVDNGNNLSGDMPVFLNRSGIRMSRHGLSNRMKSMSESANIGRDVKLSDLRATFAQNIYKKTEKNIASVHKYLRLSENTNIMGYLLETQSKEQKTMPVDLMNSLTASYQSKKPPTIAEPTEQTPDIIPADTIDLFTMSELESEFKNRGVELTAEVRAKINASDMPEMQHIAKMLRGNAKTITIRLSVLNEIAGQLVKSEKKVSWYEKIMTKLEPKQSPDAKTSIKETSELLEVESKSIDTVNIAALSKKQTLDFIRNRLQFKERIYLRNVTGNYNMAKEHRRFDMSGYDDSKCGDCTLHNLAILNEFADLGIYDYTDYLFLDFYKGQPTLYMRYFKDDKHLDFELCGWTTSEIIYFIFQKTILSGKNKRRRD